jgi:hypothetical protein
MDGVTRFAHGTPGVLRLRQICLRAGLIATGLLSVGAAGAAAPVHPVRAAYFYHYMPADHIDLLAASGFNRAVIHLIADSLSATETQQLRGFDERGRAHGMDVVPQFLLDAPARLDGRPADRRYTWGRGQVEPVACPMDSVFWASALLDRAGEILTAVPGTMRIAVDLELHRGSRKHYNAGPCRCPHCLFEYRPDDDAERRARASTSGLHAFQESRLTRILTGVIGEFAARHPGVELGVFDLDLDSYVHRALARALAGTGVPVADYCERSYSSAGAPLAAVRQRLRALGLDPVSLIGGLWLKRFAPSDVGPALASVLERADGYFVFTTFSLWLDPARLEGPYTLLGPQQAYWNALGAVNRSSSFDGPSLDARAARGEP